ncbi:MAG TPA: radical SAM protein [Burkholderiales bacterium]|nr:radical SAM protein [Burkholderiales bacterium]
MGTLNRIDSLSAPLLVTWQLTRDCDLACLHCCTESAPGKGLPDELDATEALRIADEIVRMDVPYVMLCGGEPLVVPHFRAVAHALGSAGVQLKIETNGQRFDAGVAESLARLPVRSVQVSLDADTQTVYGRQRPGGSLAKAHAACRAIRAAGLPLEITFAPTRINIHEAADVIRRAHELGAFRFNTGRLMRIGTAARQWGRLELTDSQYRDYLARLSVQSRVFEGRMELCYSPFTIEDALRASLAEPPATLLVLPNGWVKVSAALPHVCASLREVSLGEAWRAYRNAWHDAAVVASVRRAGENAACHAQANQWQRVAVSSIDPSLNPPEAAWAT